MEKWLVTYSMPEDGVLWDSSTPQWSCEVEIDSADHDSAVERIHELIAERTRGTGVYVDATKVD